MKKAVLLLFVFLFAGSTGTTYAQNNRTLSHGFSVHAVIGIPMANYGYTDQKLIISNFRLMIGAKF